MEREVIGKKADYDTVSVSEPANALDGSYAGFQPKPAVEVIIVAIKPRRLTKVRS